jgi:hypothetical protein
MTTNEKIIVVAAFIVCAGLLGILWEPVLWPG